MNKINLSLGISALIVLVVLVTSLSKQNLNSSFNYNKKSLASVSSNLATNNIIYLPVISSGYCRVTGATNSNPIHITVENISSCNIQNDSVVYVGQLINIGEVRSSANIHMENSFDTNNLVRVVKNLNNNSFDIYKADGITPVASNGSWSHGGIVRLVEPRVLRDHPILYFDGANGSIAQNISSTGLNGWWNSNRLERKAIEQLSDSYVSSYGSNFGVDGNLFETTIQSLRWWAEGKPTSSNFKTAAIWGLQNIDQYWPTFACNENIPNCDQTDSSYADYKGELYPHFPMQAYSLMRSNLSSQERQKIIDYWLNDLEWKKGGHNYNGTDLSKPQWKTVDGTVSYINGGTTVTGSGTSFKTQLVVGDFISLPSPSANVYAGLYKITAINNNTSLNIYPPANHTASNQSYAVGPAWSNNQYGYLWQSKHWDSVVTCGNDWFATYPSCPEYGINAGIYADPLQNHTIGRIMAHLSVGLALSQDDPRARWLAMDSAVALYDFLWPRVMSSWTNVGTSAQRGYHPTRTLNQMATMFGFLKSSFTDSPEYAPSKWWKQTALWQLGSIIPGRSTIWPSQESAFDVGGVGNALPGFDTILFQPTLNESPFLRYWISNLWPTYTVPYLKQSKDYGIVAFIGNRPDVLANSPNNSSLMLTSTLISSCISQYGLLPCYDAPRFVMFSRSDWTNSSTGVYFDMVSQSKVDHGSQEHEVSLFLSKNGKIFTAGDGDSDDLLGNHSVSKKGNIVIGSDNNFKTHYQAIGKTVIERSYGTNDVAAVTANITDHYLPAANANAVRRSVIHAKSGSKDYIIERIDVNLSSSANINSRYNSWIGESCGSPSNSSCVSFSSSNKTLTNTQSGAKLLTKFFGGTVSTENNSDTNGTYKGGGGYVFRVNQSVNSNSASFINVHRPTSNTSEVLSNIIQGSSGNFKYVEIQDSSSPKIIAIADGNNYSSVSFGSSYSGNAQLVVSGLSAGTYKVKSNGVDVSGCTNITINLGEYTLNCNTVPSGTISVSFTDTPADTTPPSINSVSSDSISADSVANQPPIVYAGDNKTIEISDTLNTEATATDDSPSNTLSYRWSIESATGNVLFSDPDSLNTSIRFTEVGAYKLLLDVSDGVLTSRDYIIVTVRNSQRNSQNSQSNNSNNPNSGNQEQAQNQENRNNNEQTQNSQSNNSNSASSTASNTNQNQSSNSQNQNNQNSLVSDNSNNQNSQQSSYVNGGPPSNIGGGSDYLFSKDTNDVFTYDFSKNTQNTQRISSSNTGQILPNTVNSVYNSDTSLPSTIKTSSNPTSYSTAVSFGKRNSEVLVLQNILNKQGILSNSSKTGYFGDNTLQALKVFQIKNKLATVNSENYGKVDIQTQKKIDELSKFYQLSSKKTASTQNISTSNKNNAKPIKLIERDLKKDTEGEDVRNLQKVLVKEGLLKNSNVTGYFGSSTETAVKKFQVRYKILPSNTKSPNYGVVGPDTRKVVNEKLGSISNM